MFTGNVPMGSVQVAPVRRASGARAQRRRRQPGAARTCRRRRATSYHSWYVLVKNMILDVDSY